MASAFETFQINIQALGKHKHKSIGLFNVKTPRSPHSVLTGSRCRCMPTHFLRYFVGINIYIKPQYCLIHRVQEEITAHKVLVTVIEITLIFDAENHVDAPTLQIRNNINKCRVMGLLSGPKVLSVTLKCYLVEKVKWKTSLF